MKKTSVLRNICYTVAASLLLNGVLQLFVYPRIHNTYGDAYYGDMLYLLSIISIVAAGFGGAPNYARMVAANFDEQPNGDFNRCLLYSMGLLIPVAVLVTYPFGLAQTLLMCALTCVTVLRYYGEVNFKLSLNFRRFFLYYVCVVVGYCAGLLLLRLWGMWEIAFLLGETLAVLFAVGFGTTFRRPLFQTSPQLHANLRTAAVLICSELLCAGALNADRVMIKLMLDAESVSVFYTATLIGKMAAMLTGPLSNVIMGYLARSRDAITPRKFLLFEGIILLCSAIGVAVCCVASGIFVRLLYPDLYDAAKPYFLLGNAAQLLYFANNIGMAVILFFSKGRHQFYINAGYVLLLILLSAILIRTNGLIGMAVGMLLANGMKFLVVALLGARFIRTAGADPCGKEKEAL